MHLQLFWGELLKHKEFFFSLLCKFNVGNGENTRFWEDWWVGSRPLKDLYPRLYNISFDHNISVAEAVNRGWQGFSFRRTLTRYTTELWNSPKQRCEKVRMHGGQDQPLWMLTKSRQFSVKSLYSKLIGGSPTNRFSQIWKARIPPKVKIFYGKLSGAGCLRLTKFVREMVLVHSYVPYVVAWRIRLISSSIVSWLS